MIIWGDLVNLWMVAFLALGAFLVFRKPMMNYGFPRPLELTLATTCFLIYFFHASLVVIVPFIEAQNLAGQPCTTSMPEVQCYNLSKNNCSKAWVLFAKDCDSEIRQKMNPKNMSALVGPEIKRCVYKKMDRSFHSTRKMATEDSAFCQDFFAELDAPSL